MGPTAAPAAGGEALTGRPEPAEMHLTTAIGSPKQRAFFDQQPAEVEMGQQRDPACDPT
jgi:hypothetical protein